MIKNKIDILKHNGHDKLYKNSMVANEDVHAGEMVHYFRCSVTPFR